MIARTTITCPHGERMDVRVIVHTDGTVRIETVDESIEGESK